MKTGAQRKGKKGRERKNRENERERKKIIIFYWI
jgi:hypothetical protein